MNNFKECKRIMIGKKQRILYKLPNSNKLYIKSNGRMVAYTEYKKYRKQKGGYAYTEEDKYKNPISRNGINYIRDLDYPDKNMIYEDPISGEELKQEDAMLFDAKFYDVNSLHTWINTSASTKTVPHSRRKFTPNEIYNINNFYHNRNNINNFDNNFDNNIPFYLQLKNGGYFKLISHIPYKYITVPRIEEATPLVASKSYTSNRKYYRIYEYGNIKQSKHIVYETDILHCWEFMLDNHHQYFYPKNLIDVVSYDDKMKIIRI